MADRFSFCGSTAGPFNSGANHLWSHQTGAAPTQAGPGGSGLGILVVQQPPIHAQQRPRDPAAREGKLR